MTFLITCFWAPYLECLPFLSRLGWLIRFISHSVISGFTTASAIVIGLSQAKYFLGYDITRSSKIVPLVKSIIKGADGVCFICRSDVFLIYYSYISMRLQYHPSNTESDCQPPYVCISTLLLLMFLVCYFHLPTHFSNHRRFFLL